MTISLWVVDLNSAAKAYWAARNRREEQAAYHEILLFGGRDGYPRSFPWRCAIARWLRIAALWIEKP